MPSHDYLPATRKTSPLLPIVTAACLLLCLGLGYAYWRASSDVARLKNDPSHRASAEAAQLLAAIGKHMVLPQEKPTIATVEDTHKLQDQLFFKDAQNGDKVLLYAKSKKAILYRPSIGKVIEVAHLTVKSGAAADTPPQ